MVDHPFGINPLFFSLGLFGCLLLFVLYLLLPRGVRVGYFGSYPKRYTWQAKPRRRRPVSTIFEHCCRSTCNEKISAKTNVLLLRFRVFHLNTTWWSNSQINQAVVHHPTCMAVEIILKR